MHFCIGLCASALETADSPSGFWLLTSGFFLWGFFR